MKYSDEISNWLLDLGFTHFFYVGGGNIMHLTESLSNNLKGIPVIHEVAAVIGSEYFNETSRDGRKSLALVTAGPGLTNTITGIAGAWLENRFVLILGGQVKTSDLKGDSGIRQRGIQEIDGVTLLKSIVKKSIRLNNPIPRQALEDVIKYGCSGKKGPIFIEFPLDIQAIEYKNLENIKISKRVNYEENNKVQFSKENLKTLLKAWSNAKKPIILVGGGIDREFSAIINQHLNQKKIPCLTTYNGADRIDSNYPYYFGRPNTWGQRSSNIIIQKADLIIAFGTRLGLQQTGFNWQEFGREAKIIQIDIDKSELEKGHPEIDFGIQADANPLLIDFLKNVDQSSNDEWLEYCKYVRTNIPRIEDVNFTGEKYISPYNFIIELEEQTKGDDIIIPCSSGSAFTLTMQLWQQKLGQRIVTNKSLASMGYGLSGAIGASIANPNNRTILIEGDGGFAQNIQEIGTAKMNNCNLKVFIFNDEGHASIRMTQRNYFNGKYLGCDTNTGLGLPNWYKVFKGWNLRTYCVNRNFTKDPEFHERFNNPNLEIFIVEIDPQQTYFPKISSRVTADGGMESNPLDKMSPEISLNL